MKFEKVSFEQFKKNMEEVFNIGDDTISKDMYDKIELPKRATAHSAGYDIYLPFPVSIQQGDRVPIPTGLRCKLDPDKFLMIVPRSSLGFKHGITLANTAGIIDSDYYNADNEGHIIIVLKSGENVCFDAGTKIAQAIILPYCTTKDDTPITEERTGGFGSTDVK